MMMPAKHSTNIWRTGWGLARLLAFYARSVPAHPGKVRVLKRMIALCGQKEITCRHASTATRFVADTTDFVGWEILTKGSFESASLEVCLEIMRQHGGVFADIGAHHGLFSTTVSSLPVSVLSFEPNPASFLRLQSNVRLNGRENVKLVHSALGSRASLLPWRHAGESEGTTAWSHGARAGEVADYWLGSVTFMDALAATGTPAPTMVKMDVEGAELAVLEGFDFERCRPLYFLIEAQPHWGAKYAFLTRQGYEASGENGAKLTGADSDLFLEGNALFRRI
jgi:FkbM family methyltransferase